MTDAACDDEDDDETIDKNVPELFAPGNLLFMKQVEGRTWQIYYLEDEAHIVLCTFILPEILP